MQDLAEYNTIVETFCDRYELYSQRVRDNEKEAARFAAIPGEHYPSIHPVQLATMQLAHSTYNNALQHLAAIEEASNALARRIAELQESAKLYDSSVHDHAKITSLNEKFAAAMAKPRVASVEKLMRVRHVVSSCRHRPLHIGAPGRYIVLRPEEINELKDAINTHKRYRTLDDDLRDELLEFYKVCDSGEDTTIEFSFELLELLQQLLERYIPARLSKPVDDEAVVARQAKKTPQDVPAISAAQAGPTRQELVDKISKKFGTINAKTFEKKRAQGKLTGSFRFDAFDPNLAVLLRQEAEAVIRSFQLIGCDYKIETVSQNADGILFWQWTPEHCQVLHDTLVDAVSVQTVHDYDRYQIRQLLLVQYEQLAEAYPGLTRALEVYVPAFFETFNRKEMVQCLSGVAYARCYSILRNLLRKQPPTVDPGQYQPRMRGAVTEHDRSKLMHMLQYIPQSKLVTACGRLGMVQRDVMPTTVRPDVFWEVFDDVYSSVKPDEDEENDEMID